MRYLSLLLCISYSGLIAQTTSIPSGYFHNEVFNYVFPHQEDNGIFKPFYKSPNEKKVVNDNGDVIDVYGGFLYSDSEDELIAEQSLGGYIISTDTFNLYIRTWANGVVSPDMVPYLLPKEFFDLKQPPEPILWGDMKIWTTEKVVNPTSYNSRGEEYKVISSYLGVQLGNQFMGFYLSALDGRGINQEDFVGKAVSIFNQIEVNGVGFQFLPTVNGKWEVRQKSALVSTARSVDEINEAVDAQMRKVSMGPSIEIVKEKEIADKGPFYNYGVPQDALTMKIPEDVFYLSARSKSAYTKMMYLSDDKKIIQIPDFSFSGAEKKVLLDSSMAKIISISAKREVSPSSKINIYSFENQQLISGDVQRFFNDDAEKKAFEEQLLPDGVSTICYTKSLRTDLTFPSNGSRPRSEEARAVIILKRKKALHVITLSRQFAFQLVEMLNDISYHGYQFKFNYKDEVLSLKEVLQQGEAPDESSLEKLRAFRAQNPEVEEKKKSLQRYQKKEAEEQLDGAKLFYDNLQAGTPLQIDSSVSIKPTALFFSKSMETSHDLTKRGLTVEFLVEPHSPFCFDIVTANSDLIIMDDMGYQLVGDGKFFSTREFYQKNPDADALYLPEEGWRKNTSTSIENNGVQFTVNAHSYVLPSEGAQYIHLQGRLHLKYYAEEVYDVDARQGGDSNTSIKFFYIDDEAFSFMKLPKNKSLKKQNVYRLHNKNNIPIVQIELIDENGNSLGQYSPNDDFVFEQSEANGFIVPKIRATLAKVQTIPVVVDEYISLGINQNE